MKIEEVVKELEEGVVSLYESDKYKAYLEFMGRFHNYSANNCILIFLQMPTASLVAGYQTWAKQNRQVRKGEKGLRILAPVPHKIMVKKIHADGREEEEERTWNSFRPVSVFDISQTDGEAIPEICEELKGDVKDYENLLEKVVKCSPVPVKYEEIKSGAKGYFSDIEHKIVIQKGMSEEQTLKTLIHEVAHSLLHGKDGEESEATRSEKEVQAESVSYTVCTMLGIDTSDYSFGYIASWGSKDVKELCKSMEVIRKTADKIIKEVAA